MNTRSTCLSNKKRIKRNAWELHTECEFDSLSGVTHRLVNDCTEFYRNIRGFIRGGGKAFCSCVCHGGQSKEVKSRFEKSTQAGSPRHCLPRLQSRNCDANISLWKTPNPKIQKSFGCTRRTKQQLLDYKSKNHSAKRAKAIISEEIILIIVHFNYKRDISPLNGC